MSTSTATTRLTVLTPATSNETRDAIEALLMLGNLPITDNIQSPEDDNELLVPILGAKTTPASYAPAKVAEPDKSQLKDKDTAKTDDENDQENQEPTDNKGNVNNELVPKTPLLGTILGTAIKTDVELRNPGNNKPEVKPMPAKKELSFK